MPTSEPGHRVFTVQLPVELHRRASTFAADDERSLSWLVRHALAEYLERHETPKEAT